MADIALEHDVHQSVHSLIPPCDPLALVELRTHEEVDEKVADGRTVSGGGTDGLRPPKKLYGRNVSIVIMQLYHAKSSHDTVDDARAGVFSGSNLHRISVSPGVAI